MNSDVGLGMTSDRTRLRMVESLREQGIRDEEVLLALNKVPRHLFVDEALASRAYELVSLPIGFGQTISHPFMVARLCEHIMGDVQLDRVLEIGSGCGYQAAILSHIANEVISIDRNARLLSSARIRLKKMGYRGVRFRHADGWQGLSEEAPFSAIIVTAAAPEVPEALFGQLTNGGSLVLPIGVDSQKLIKFTRLGDSFTEQTLEGVKFVPLLHGLA